MIGFCDCDKPVVTNLLLAVELFAFDDSKETSTDGAAREGRLIHQEQNVDRIAVLSASLRQKTEITGKCHPSRKDLFERENALVRIEGKLVPVTFWGLHDELKNAILFMPPQQNLWADSGSGSRPRV